MKTFFHPDSKAVRFLTVLCNLVILNFLWILTSLPVVTVGASNSAMFAVLFQYLDQGSDAVVKPYFKAFAANFKQSTQVWIPVLLVGVLLLLDGWYLTGHAGDVSCILWIPFGLLLAALMAAGTFIFGLIPRYQNTTQQLLRKSVLIFLMNLFPSVAIILVQALPLLFFLFWPSMFLRIGILWLMLGVSGFGYINAATMLRIFKKYLPDEEKTPEV